MSESLKSLIEEAKTLNTDLDRVKYICDYVVNNVNFNYAEILKNALFEDIDGLCDLANEEDISAANYKDLILIRLTDRLNEIGNSTFTDKELQAETINNIITALKKDPEEKNLLRMLGNITRIVCGPTYNNELLTSGVCSDITDFLSSCFKELNIKYVRVIGNGHASHEWIICYLDGMPYHMDLTYSLYKRDGSYNVSGDIDSYYLMSMDELFELDPTRTIKSIGLNMLETPITADNYKDMYNNFNKRK